MLPSTRASSRSKSKSKKDSNEDAQLAPASKKIKKEPKETKIGSPKKAAKSKSPFPPPQKKAKPKKELATKTSSVKGYTDEQYEYYKQLLNDLQSKKIDALKEMLKKNDQTITGTKEELIKKVADGKALGKIPRCEKCDWGRPKFDYETGIYECPGYRDGYHFISCNKKYTLDELEREEWQLVAESESPSLLPQKEPKPKKEVTKKAPVKGYTDEQYEHYKQLLNDLQSEKNDTLKEMLRKNDQTITGTKEDLIKKVADGKVLGKIPRCEKCDWGRPKFDYETGIYECPGYQDGYHFRSCYKKYTLDELKREEWQD